jgi:hypothetical protein
MKFWGCLLVSLSMGRALGLFILSVAFLAGCSSDETKSPVGRPGPDGVVLGGGESSGGGGEPLNVAPELIKSYIENIRMSFVNGEQNDTKLRLLFFRPFKRVADLKSKNATSDFFDKKFATAKVKVPQNTFLSFYKKIIGADEIVVSEDLFDLYQQINIDKLKEDLSEITWIYDECAKVHGLPDHKHASFSKNSNGSVLCFDTEKLSGLSPDTFKNQIMALFLHELGHMYGYNEDECVVLQKIFFWIFETEKASSMHQVRLFDLISKVEINQEKWCSSDSFTQTFSDTHLNQLYSHLVSYPLTVEATVEDGTKLEQEVLYLLKVIESFLLDPSTFKTTFCVPGEVAEFDKIHYHLNLLRSYLLGED